MEGLFLQILNMSISASWLIVVVLILRWILQKLNAPKKFCYILWFFVAIRLLCPISLESGLSLIPSGETFSEEFLYEEQPEINSGIEEIDNVVNPIISQQTMENLSNQENENTNISDGITMDGGNHEKLNTSTGNDTENINGEGNLDTNGTTATGMYPAQTMLQVSSVIWGIGIIVMLVYTLISYMKLRNTIAVSIYLRDNLWICDEIQSPFILGLLNPRIYLPSHIKEEQIPYIVAHEKEHLKYHDNCWKPLGFGILTIYWFNPLVWVAYICMCRDIELACDERVISDMNTAEKKQYMESLLLCSSPRHLISACPVAFGEIGIKERIKNIINYRKPVSGVFGVGAVLCVIVALCFLTNPKEKTNFEEGTSSVTVEDIYREKEYRETVLYETEADLTHDGVLEKVQLVMYMPKDVGDFGEAVANLRSPNNYTRVKVYEGYGYSDYASEPIYTSEAFGIAAENKGTIGLTTWNGESYLFIAHMNEIDDYADYSYSVFYFEDGKEKTIASDEVQFSKEDNPYAWVTEEGQGFQTNLSQKVREGIVLAGFDSDVMVCHGRVKQYASNYFNEFWNPGNVVVNSQLMLERIRELELESPIETSLQVQFIEDIDAQIAEYFEDRESTYVVDDTESERGLALEAWEKRLQLLVEDAELGYVYDDVYEVSESERVVLIYEVGFMDCYYPNEDEKGKLFVNTEHLFTFRLENGQWKYVSDAYLESYLGYEQGLDLADWEVYLHGAFADFDLERLYELQNTNLSVWFGDYNGETIQCIRGAESTQPSVREDIVYYRTDETDVQVILKRMIEEMMEPLMEESDERPYTITKYRIDDSEVYQVNENIWYVTYLNGYYKYEGMDMATFEGRLEYEEVDEDGLLPFERQGTAGVFSYILLKEGDVYCLRRFGSMDY